METTLNKIKSHAPSSDGWEKLLNSLNKTQADDEPLSILHIIESNGIQDAIWALRAVDGWDREIRLFAVWCARQVQHLMSDERSLKALDVAERYANGNATYQELNAAAADADAAASDALAAASDAYRAAAMASWAAARAAWACAADAAATVRAAGDAWTADRADATDAAARATQKEKLIEIINNAL